MKNQLLIGMLTGILAAGWCVEHRAFADDDTPPPETATAPEPTPTASKYVKVTTPLHAYEYAVLRIIDLPDHEVEAQLQINKLALDEVGHNGPESGRRKLLRDIGGHGFAPTTLPLLNELGSQGWELIFMDGDDRNGSYTFKRQTK